MKDRNFLGLILSVMLLLLAAGSALARGAQPVGYPAASGANAGSAANAPWFISTVDSAVGFCSHVSVAIDPDSGTTYISYYDETNTALKMAKHVGSGGNCGPNDSWSCQTIDSSEDVGKYSSIAINPASGEAGIAYHDATNGKLKYAYRSCAPLCWWVNITVDQGIFPVSFTGLYTSLKYHSNGTAYIAYYFNNPSGVDALMVASYVGSGGNCGYGTVAGEWQCDTIQTGEGVGQYASLALDGSGQPRIAYYDGGTTALMYAYNNGVSWTRREILPVNSGLYASLAVDVNNGDLPHIAHYNPSTGKLGYAVYVGSNGNCGFNSSSTKFEWQCDEIATMGTGTHPRTRDVSLAVDKAGFPIIAYSWYYGTPFSIRGFSWVRPAAALGLQSGNCGPQDLWQCEGIDGAWTGDYSAIAVSPSGLATIAYNVSQYPGGLRVAYQQFQVYLPLIVKNQ